MSSSRLPGKVLADIGGKTMLCRVVEQVRRAELVEKVVVATSSQSPDDAIAAECALMNVPCFRGSEDDVLERFHGAAVSVMAHVIVRLTADCPMLDPKVIDRVIAAFQQGSFDYVSNTIDRTFPDGLDVEVFSFAALDRAMREARWKSEREHVTPYIWKNPEMFRLSQVVDPCDHSQLRWTVDQGEDLDFARAIYRCLGKSEPSLETVLDAVAASSGLDSINSGIVCNEGYLKSIAEDLKVPISEQNL